MLERILRTIEQRGLAGTEAPVLLMVSGGSDSTALAYLASDLREHGALGELAMLHVNHRLRGADADADAEFVRSLAEALGLAFFLVEIDVGSIALQEGANIEAVARRERYAAAQEALGSLCRRAMKPVCDGRIFTAHTADDRVESFYMRSIVGTGPGGFRSMRYRNGAIARPCMDVSRQDLRDYLARRALDVEAGEDKPLVRTTTGDLWREDATNAHTDQFRAYVRHEIVPKAVQRNARLLETLSRTMDLIADEDDMLDVWAQRLVREQVEWLASMQWNRESGAEAAWSTDGEAEDGTDDGASAQDGACDYAQGCIIAPDFGRVELPLQRRVAMEVLKRMLGRETRIDTSSVDAVAAAFSGGFPVSGYTNNIQGDLALSANKRGLRIEPMSSYRARRKRGKVH